MINPIQVPTAAEIPQVLELLATQKLPVDDIGHPDTCFFVWKKDKKILGVIGIEIYGECGLLRSLATDPGFRNQGIASGLVEHLLLFARETGIKKLFLLTETAAGYFSKKGFHLVSREQVPEEIRQSSEFSYVCPGSAIVMEKDL